MSPLTREASSETRQHGEPSIVPCPIVKSATSASAFRIPLVVPLGVGRQMHLRAGLRVSTSSATGEHDAVVMLGIGAGSFRLNAPCRVVYIIDEPNRQGFAYAPCPAIPNQVKRRLSSSGQTMTPSDSA
jgi:hypothetical protein